MLLISSTSLPKVASYSTLGGSIATATSSTFGQESFYQGPVLTTGIFVSAESTTIATTTTILATVMLFMPSATTLLTMVRLFHFFGYSDLVFW